MMPTQYSCVHDEVIEIVDLFVDLLLKQRETSSCAVFQIAITFNIMSRNI